MAVPDQKHLKLSVLDETNNKPELVGDVIIQLAPAFDSKPDVGYDDWHELQFKDKYAGEVYLEMTFYPAKPMLPSKPREIMDLQYRNSLIARPGSLRSMHSMSSMSGSTAARALPPYPTEERVGNTPVQPVQTIKNSSSAVSMPDLPERPNSMTSFRRNTHSHSPLPVPGSFTYNHDDSESDSGDEEFERQFHNSPAPPLPELPDRANKRFSLPLPPLPPPHSKQARRDSDVSNDFSNLSIRQSNPLPSLPIEPHQSIPQLHLPFQKPVQPPPTQQPASQPPIQHHPIQIIPSPASLARNVNRSPSPNKPQVLHSNPPPLSVADIPPIPQPTITASASSITAASTIRKPVLGSVKRKPVGGGSTLTPTITHILSDDDTEKLENLPFSPDSYNTAPHTAPSTHTCPPPHLPTILQPPHPDEILSFKSYAPEPVPRKKEKPLPPSGVDPGIAGYNGDGQWTISQQLNAGYGDSLYNKMSSPNNRPKKKPSKPRLPPKIPEGMTREEYMAAEPPRPRDPFVYRDYV